MVSASSDHPIFIAENDDGTSLYGFPAIDGPRGGVKVAFARKGTPCTPDTIDRTVHAHEIAAVRRRAGELLPSLRGACLRTVTCMYSNTPDRHFVIGRHRRCPGVTVACGFSGHGFKFVPVIGEILADLVIDGISRQPISMFGPDRFASG